MEKINVEADGVWYGVMAWWKEVADAARYIVRLYIGNTEIACVEKDRNTKYHTFEGLASGRSYNITVAAENRSGDTIAQSSSTSATVVKYEGGSNYGYGDVI